MITHKGVRYLKEDDAETEGDCCDDLCSQIQRHIQNAPSTYEYAGESILAEQPTVSIPAQDFIKDLHPQPDRTAAVVGSTRESLALPAQKPN